MLAFAGATLLLTLTPGADTALVTRAALAGGRAAGLAANAGVASGLLVHATLSALGLSVLLAHSALAYSALRWLGAAYLIYLGVRALMNSAEHAESLADSQGVSAGLSVRVAFAQGLLTNLLNPKVALFYLTFLPPFIRPQDEVLWRSLTLASIHVTWGLLWLGVLVLLIGRFRAALTRSGVRRMMNRLTGGVLLFFGLRIALVR